MAAPGFPEPDLHAGYGAVREKKPKNITEMRVFSGSILKSPGLRLGLFKRNPVLLSGFDPSSLT